MIRHIIFDCFGTLINTGSGSINAVKKILANISSGEDPAEFYAEWKKIKRRMMKESPFRSEKTLFELSLGELFVCRGIAANASEAVKPMIDSLFAERVAFPDVAPMLERLAEKGLDFAVGSTSDTDSLTYYLERNGLKFSKVYSSEDMQVYKPFSLFYETILVQTGWKAEECLFVGDSYEDDVCGPKAVGMKTALLDRKGVFAGKTLDPAPDLYIQSFAELDIIS
jgi:2-haloalkanoic acid dehalogenase type II